MKRWTVIIWGAVLLGTLGFRPVSVGMAQVGDKVEKPVAEAVTIRQQTQQAEEQWRDERQALVAELDALEQEQAQLLEENAALGQATEAARARIAVKEQELADIEQLSARIQPFMEEQLVRIGEIIAADLPFLTDERQRRLAALTALMGEPDVAVSEKLRKIMEALFVEAEYGDTIEVYQQTIIVDSQAVLVDIFRLGRLALFYQTLDRKRCGFYDVAASAWQPLPGRYNRTIQAAVEIGSRRKPVELLNLPLGRMVAQ
ncbi:MAG: DUF3450 domain-containing protein [Desulfatitalea sp.]|nr:DUF3450 domain-containing protein [Desulfatitalea sp.]